jgi:hypothetical protein
MAGCIVGTCLLLLVVYGHPGSGPTVSPWAQMQHLWCCQHLCQSQPSRWWHTPAMMLEPEHDGQRVWPACKIGQSQLCLGCNRAARQTLSAGCRSGQLLVALGQGGHRAVPLLTAPTIFRRSHDCVARCAAHLSANFPSHELCTQCTLKVHVRTVACQNGANRHLLGYASGIAHAWTVYRGVLTLADPRTLFVACANRYCLCSTACVTSCRVCVALAIGCKLAPLNYRRP